MAVCYNQKSNCESPSDTYLIFTMFMVHNFKFPPLFLFLNYQNIKCLLYLIKILIILNPKGST